MDNVEHPWDEEYLNEDSSKNEKSKKQNVLELPNEPDFTPQGNQARVHSKASYTRRYKNLQFMTDYEEMFHRALENYVLSKKDRATVYRSQCPAEFFDGERIRRVQPDAEIIHRNFHCVAEIDGSSHFFNSPAFEQHRLEGFSFNGSIIYRIDAPEPGYDLTQLKAWAEEEVAKTFEYINNVIDGRK